MTAIFGEPLVFGILRFRFLENIFGPNTSPGVKDSRYSIFFLSEDPTSTISLFFCRLTSFVVIPYKGHLPAIGHGQDRLDIQRLDVYAGAVSVQVVFGNAVPFFENLRQTKGAMPDILSYTPEDLKSPGKLKYRSKNVGLSVLVLVQPGRACE